MVSWLSIMSGKVKNYPSLCVFESNNTPDFERGEVKSNWKSGLETQVMQL